MNVSITNYKDLERNYQETHESFPLFNNQNLTTITKS